MMVGSMSILLPFRTGVCDLRVSLWWSLCTFYFLAFRVRFTQGHSSLYCCVYVTSFDRLTAFCVDSCAVSVLVLFCTVHHFFLFFFFSFFLLNLRMDRFCRYDLRNRLHMKSFGMCICFWQSLIILKCPCAVDGTLKSFTKYLTAEIHYNIWTNSVILHKQ